MKSFIIVISKEDAIMRMKRHIDNCDDEELAELIGKFFGGKCLVNSGVGGFAFAPDENYFGEFDDLRKKAE